MILDIWPSWAKKVVLELTGIGWGVRILSKAQQQSASKAELIEKLFERNNIQLRVNGSVHLNNRRGCLFVSNHPHGFLDGLVLIWLGSQYGFDTRAITRHYTSVFTPIRELLFFAKTDNSRTTRNGQQVVDQASVFVHEGGALAICAAGRMAEARPFWTDPQEVDWKTGSARIANASQAPIVLVHIEIDPSLLRQMVHVLNPVLRNLMQIWTYLFGKSHQITLSVLEVVEPEQLPDGDAKAQTQWLRRRYEEGVALLSD